MKVAWTGQKGVSSRHASVRTCPDPVHVRPMITGLWGTPTLVTTAVATRNLVARSRGCTRGGVGVEVEGR